MSDKKIKPLTDEEILKMSKEDIDLHFKRLELAAKQTEFQDIGERLAERQIKRENKESRARMNGLTLKNIALGNVSSQSRCNHRKGGMDVKAIVEGQGTDNQYAVLKHRFASGDIWVRCLRCGKWWTPPAESDFMVDGKLDKVAFSAAEKEYQDALNFPTLNTMSTGIVFEFSDGGKVFRERTKNAGK